jgi:hypothetical protein
MRGAIPPLPQLVFMAWCSVKHRDNFTFTFKTDEFWDVSQVKVNVKYINISRLEFNFPLEIQTYCNTSFSPSWKWSTDRTVYCI